MRLETGSRLGPYEIVSPLGAGGMGEVYRARDSRLGREVAVKVLPERLAKDAEALARFEREARAIAALSHPNIVAIHDFGNEGGVSYAVTELLEGENLRQRLQRGSLPWRKALETSVAVAEGLAAGHAKGIFHRDLKPENIFLTSDGWVKILDFGLARWKSPAPQGPASAVATESVGTDPGTVLGTVGYMSPEQVRGLPVEAPGDIFSLGCVLYEMITGRRAFFGSSAAETLSAILNEEPPEMGSSGKNLPPDLDRVIGHCLEKPAQQRFQSARDLGFALKAILSGSGAAKATAAPRRAKTIDSLAVLPFANAGADPNAEYLSDGITESLINSLSQLPKLKVVARSTAFRYKGRDVDPQVAGRELNVRAVLTGRVVERGEVLSIQADLVDVADGNQIWGDRYNRKSADIFAVEEEIAAQITEKLRGKLSGEERKRLARRQTQNTEAYQLYLKGRHFWNKRTEEATRKSIECFQQAIDKDPGYALAYSGLADAYCTLAVHGGLAPREAFPRAKAAARRALELDDKLAEAHTSLALAQGAYDWETDASVRSLERALELNPNYVVARQQLAYSYMILGRTEEALVEIQRAIDADPLSLLMQSRAAMIYYFNRRYDEAAERYRKILDMDANYWAARAGLGQVYAQTGRHAEAIAEQRAALEPSGRAPTVLGSLGYAYAVGGEPAQARRLLEELMERGRHRYVPAFFLAEVYAGLGETDPALDWLERALEERAVLLSFGRQEPMLDSVRSHPRFAELLRRARLEK